MAEDDTRTFEVTLILTLDKRTMGALGPEYWDWQDLLDLNSLEHVYVLNSKEVEDEI